MLKDPDFPVSSAAARARVQGSGVWRVDPERGQLLVVKREPEGTGVRSSTTRKFSGEIQAATEARCHRLWHAKGTESKTLDHQKIPGPRKY